MKRESVNYLVVGGFVLLVFLSFLVVMFKITGGSGPADEYFVIYDNVSGIVPGTAVYYEGFEVGQVDSVSPPKPGYASNCDVEGFHVKFHVDRMEEEGGGMLAVAKGMMPGGQSGSEPWPIPDDSIAKVVASGLLSAVSLNISGGTSGTNLSSGDEICGEGQVNLFAAINDVAALFRDLSERRIRPVLDNLNYKISLLATEYTDLSRSTIRPFLETVQTEFLRPDVTADLRSTVSRLNDSAARIKELVGDENQARIRSILVNVDNASAELDTFVAGIEATRGELNTVLAHLDGLIVNGGEDIDQTLYDARAALGELKVVLDEVSEHADAVMYNVESGTRHFSEFARSVRDNPSLLLRGGKPPENGEEQ